MISLLFLILPLALIEAAPARCPPLPGSFTLNERDLYPEGADWDLIRCKLYTSAAYNVSVLEYDPYTNTSNTIEVPGLTGDVEDYHMNGVDFSPVTGDLYFIAGSAKAFEGLYPGMSNPINNTGPNVLVRYSPSTQGIVYQTSMKPAQDAFFEKLGNYTSGFQDMATTSDGITYAVGTFGNSIARIDKDGGVSLYYAPEQYNASYGFGGIFALGNKLVVSDSLTGGLVTFETANSAPATAIYVKPEGQPNNYTTFFADGLLAPRKYGGRVALWSDDYYGTVVYGSDDCWKTAKYLGVVANELAEAGGNPTATVEIGDKLFVSTEYFQFTLPVKAKSDFPFLDVTSQVDDMVATWESL